MTTSKLDNKHMNKMDTICFVDSLTIPHARHWFKAFNTYWECLIYHLLVVQRVRVDENEINMDTLDDHPAVFVIDVSTDSDSAKGNLINQISVRIFSEAQQIERANALGAGVAVDDLPSVGPEDYREFIIDRADPPAWAVHYIMAAQLQAVYDGIEEGISELEIWNGRLDQAAP